MQNDPFLRNYKPIEPTPDLPFRLQEGEVILRALRPSKKIVVKFAFSTIIAVLVLIIFFVPVVLSLVTSTASAAASTVIIALAAFAGVIIIVLVVGILFGYLGYTKYRYWITNHRTIGKRGIVGYSFDSMPLENVADVVVSRGILDRILGISTIYIQPIGGSGFMVPVRGFGMNRYTGSNSFIGLKPEDTAELQQLIFHLRDARKRETGKIL
ncbi:MAG: PH domain-containing protein [Methanomassiliicoccales archaeon]